MKKPSEKTALTLIVEIVKWGAVIWLFWPLFSFQSERIAVWRMVCGVLLIVVYLGKMFYDVIINALQRQKERYTLGDFLGLVVTITLIAVIVGGVLVLLALYLINQMQSGESQAN